MGAVNRCIILTWMNKWKFSHHVVIKMAFPFLGKSHCAASLCPSFLSFCHFSYFLNLFFSLSFSSSFLLLSSFSSFLPFLLFTFRLTLLHSACFTPFYSLTVCFRLRLFSFFSHLIKSTLIDQILWLTDSHCLV